MKLLSDLYNVTLKRGIRGAAKGGFVRPTIGENFMTHRDFTEILSATVPGPPTIGTVTANGTSASVPFTAPINDGGSTITQYIATSTPGNITGTLNQAGSGTITVTGLSIGVSYTFKVRAVNNIGSGPESSSSNSVNTPLSIGQFVQGGYYFGTIEVSGTTYYLVAADKASGETYTTWGDYGTLVAGADSLVDGYQNTIDLEAGTKPAADFCRNLTIGGYSDWYLPAKDESYLLYTNHAALESAGAGTFESAYYWSSTEYNSNQAWLQYFGNGYQTYSAKYDNGYVRAIRRFAA